MKILDNKKEKIIKLKLSDIVYREMLNLYRRSFLLRTYELPSERQMADDFGVSRTVIRECLKKLEDKGYIEKQNSKRLFVVNESNKDILPFVSTEDLSKNEEYKKIVDLLDLRTIIETYAVKRAAERATEEEIVYMQNTIDEMAEQLKSGFLNYDLDTAFHRSIVKIANNKIIEKIYYDYNDGIHEIAEISLHIAENIGLIIIAPEEHQLILDAIKARNPKMAEKFMNNHLNYAQHNILLGFQYKQQMKKHQKDTSD